MSDASPISYPEIVNQPPGSKRFRWIYVLLGVLYVLLGVLVVGLGVYLWYFWPALEARYLFRDVPGVNEVPSDLSDNTVSTASGSTLSYLGYKFDVPWNDVDKANVKVSGNVAIIPFRSGLTVAFFTHPPHEFLDNLVKSGPAKHEQLCALYGNGACTSDYEFIRLMFKARPDDISFFTPRKESGRIWYLLVLKMALVKKNFEIFAIQTKEFKGFQFGDTTKTGDGAVDELYADDDKVEFVIARKDRQCRGISQSEINRMLQTTHKLTEAPHGVVGTGE